MEITRKLLILLFAVVTATSFYACKKDPIPGPKGDPGRNGIDGKDGNANVRGNTFTVYTNDWKLDGNLFFYAQDMPTITQNIVNNGSVQVFMELATGYWVNMPYQEYNPNDGYFSTFNFVYGLNYIEIYKIDSDLLEPENPGTRTFKVVAIASSALVAKPDLDLTDYEVLKENFDIVEAEF
ncbi:MAG: hypothetical protein H0X62_00790 [Bacteroidetes bacterium]|nr:hypothetical protein [Bacteroidota bacterium]